MSAITYEPCPVGGCTRRRNRDYLMCRPDWSKVPKHVQAAVYAAVKAWRASLWREDQDTVALGQAMRDVQADAIEAAAGAAHNPWSSTCDRRCAGEPTREGAVCPTCDYRQRRRGGR